MKKIILLLFAVSTFTSCISIKMPESIKVDIDIPADFDAEKIEVLIDTLRAQNVNATMTFEIHKKKKEDNPKL